MINIDEQKAEQLLKSFSIPPKPEVLTAMHQECAKPEPNMAVVAEIVSEDVALSASVLKAINSPVYCFSRTITDINQSIIFLGINSLNTMVNCMMLRRAFSGEASISLERFWDNSIELAQFSVYALDYLRLKSAVPKEDLYAAAMFQDCGIPPMAMRFDDYANSLKLANSSTDKQFTHVEDEIHSTNHAILGYFIATSWHLPKPLCQYILMHHERTFLEQGNFDEPAKQIFSILKLCSNVLNKYKRLEDEAEWTVIRDDVLGFLHLSEIDYDELEQDIIESYEAR